MQTKHTKGQWAIDKPSYEVINIVTDTNFICEIPCPINESEDTEERQAEAEANAKLIAAAPLLLEALYKLLKEARQNSFEINKTLNDTPTEQQAQEAINKATN